MTHVLGVGVGLFILISLWTTAIIILLVSLRTVKAIGVLVVTLTAVITVILIAIPREGETPTPVVFKLYDKLFVWRICLVILLGLSAGAGFIFILVFHLMEPRYAQPIKQWKL